MLVPEGSDYDQMMEHAREFTTRNELARKGQRVVLTAGLPLHAPGTTNTLRVEIV